MNKKVVVVLVVTLIILAIALSAFSNIGDIKLKKDNDVVQKDDSLDGVSNSVDNEEVNEETNGEVENVVINNDNNVFEVNQQYTDSRFLLTLKKYDVKDNVYKYKFEVLNINDVEETLDYSSFKCVTNQQSVDVFETGSITIDGKKRKSFELTCNSDTNDVYLTYLSTMYDGEEDIVIFGKK